MSGPQLTKTSIKAFAYNAIKPVQFLGKFEALIETKKRIAVATFYVAKTTNSGNLISATTAQELVLISLHLNKVSTTKNNNLDKILTKHSTVFQGLGKLKGDKVKLNINKEYKPGTNNPADYLSRHPTSTATRHQLQTGINDRGLY